MMYFFEFYFIPFIGLSLSASTIFQILEVRKTDTVQNISLGFWVLLANGVLWWLVYGILIQNFALILTNIVALTLDVYMVYVVVRRRYYEKNRTGKERK